MTPDPRDTHHIFESLRKGLVPERALDTFAVGIERPRAELHRQLDLAADGDGTIKFLRGGYGCGKTFMARLALHDAQARGFATSFVVVSDNDLRFYRFDDVYRKVMSGLGTAACPRGALGDILDRWIGAIEETLEAEGLDPDAPDFDTRVRERLEADLHARTGGKAPPDFVRAISTVFDLKQRGDHTEAGALLSWLAGSQKVAASAKRAADIKGDIDSGEALAYLRGVLEIVKAAGYAGLLIVVDEAETILRMRKDVRHKSLNGIRQIADEVPSQPGIFWLFTGTPDFYDNRQGVAGLAPLHDRIRFIERGGHASQKQAQLRLSPFDRDRLIAVALRLRALYPADDRDRFEARITLPWLENLADDITRGFRGDVGVVPRQFLRELVEVFDLVDEDPHYQPAAAPAYTPRDLTPEEQHAIAGAAYAAIEDDSVSEPVPVEDNW
ncbi:MAG: BREX system ATP-binding protein BrxD [bacterium]